MMSKPGLALAAIVVVAAFQCRAVADDQEQKAKAQLHQVHVASEKCTAACYACRRECESCSAHCVKLLAGGKAEHVNTLQTCRDCGDMSLRCGDHFSAGAIRRPDLPCLRRGVYSMRESCDRFADDKQMKACAEECSRCEKACQEMLRHIKRSE